MCVCVCDTAYSENKSHKIVNLQQLSPLVFECATYVSCTKQLNVVAEFIGF